MASHSFNIIALIIIYAEGLSCRNQFNYNNLRPVVYPDWFKLFPRPLLTIIVVSPSECFPASYLENSPWFGATMPPIKGSLNWPP
jgi:hypothetical protein